MMFAMEVVLILPIFSVDGISVRRIGMFRKFVDLLSKLIERTFDKKECKECGNSDVSQLTKKSLYGWFCDNDKCFIKYWNGIQW